ncbi:Phosphoglycerate mutase [Segniliparus rotundus DSM 44985]|uniref:Phosphoglycerate mutase n=1 Tax=Segniliparus rotundus (strain ATCC BAA-972 / CDC 1076 / CIP 108378 / DSM 44985 / JCM 13578) TaxID=640132 RepID=D6ZFG0_SEGRD|nr:histidine phosphatase family protein [Segniliparus rotundus]ADG97684.1 Phosphoglycerate mutase [Segniliparus rotundus DSM 44985]
MTVLLVRHARSTSNVARTLAGRSPGVGLDPHGREQAHDLVDRLAALPIRRIVRSPLQRCAETITPLAAALGLAQQVDERLSEVDYGSWTGRKLDELGGEPLWKVVQRHPSAAVFPGGEGLAQVQARALAAIRDHDRAVAQEHGPGALWLACSHGDVIKSVLADAVGSHLDQFQRLMVEPASVSVVAYTPHLPVVSCMNHTDGALPPAKCNIMPAAVAVATSAEHEQPEYDGMVGGAPGVAAGGPAEKAMEV